MRPRRSTPATGASSVIRISIVILSAPSVTSATAGCTSWALAETAMARAASASAILDSAVRGITLFQDLKISLEDRPMFPFGRLLVSAFVACSAAAAPAHEFWIDASRYQIAEGETIEAALRVGQVFEGIELSYLPNTFRRFEIALGGEVAPVDGRLGDRPALAQEVPGSGLAVAVHVTTDSTVIYREFGQFEEFVRHKDAAWAIGEHSRRGLPTDRVVEGYSRYAKA